MELIRILSNGPAPLTRINVLRGGSAGRVVPHGTKDHSD